MDGERRKAKDGVRERREREALKEWRKRQPREGGTSKRPRYRRRGRDTDGKGEYVAGSGKEMGLRIELRDGEKRMNERLNKCMKGLCPLWRGKAMSTLGREGESYVRYGEGRL